MRAGNESARLGRTGGVGTSAPASASAVSLVFALLSWAQEARSGSEDPRALVLSIALSEDDAPLEGRGPARSIEHVVDSSGRLHVWADSGELDPYLRVEEESRDFRREDDASGGGTTPYLEIEVESGMRLFVTVCSADVGAGGEVVLHLVAAPESDETLAAAEEAEAVRRDVEAARQAGELPGAREILGQAIQTVVSTRMAEDSTALAHAAWRLGFTAYGLSDLEGARAAWGFAHGFRARALPETHPDLLLARQNLAIVQKQLGDLRGALELERGVLAVRSRILSPTNPDLQAARGNLANTLAGLGDYLGARALEEQILGALSASLPNDHAQLQRARLNLAATLQALGDLSGARELEEQALEVLSRLLPGEARELQVARTNLAATLHALGDPEAARPLFELVLDVASRTLPADHPELQIARLNLANTARALGDLERARALEERCLEALADASAEECPEKWRSWAGLAATLFAAREYSGARELQEWVLEVMADKVSVDDYAFQEARRNLLWTYVALGARREAIELAGRLASSLEQSLTGALGLLSPRELEARVDWSRSEISSVLAVARGAGVFEPDPELGRQVFTLVESCRGIGLLGASVQNLLRADAELERLRAQEAGKGEELARLASAGAQRDQISAARRELDGLRRARRARIFDDPIAGALLAQPTPAALSALLAGDEALVGYWRYSREEFEPASGMRGRDSLLAHVLLAQGNVVRVELGPLEAIESAVLAWREDAVGGASGRGIAGTVPEPATFLRSTESGEALRRLVLDPLLPALGGVRRLIVALDDVLHAVPLDALPLDGGAVGERFEIELRSTLRELAWPGPPPATSLGLVVLGGASYGPLPGDADATSATSAHDPIPTFLRGTVWERGFQPLPETGPEARGLAQLYASAFGEGAESSILEERQASRERLETLAPRARFLHVATHGWFAPESIASSADQRPIAGQPWRTLSTEEQVRGTSPMLLCGLALAGANLSDGSGRRRGLITAEELASWDLSSCELAVLSACDTNVGIRRAGQGVASLQKALHMAGARSTITSLWKVPDQATRELMLDFYRRIWIEGEPRRRALWAAKMSLRDARNEFGQPIHPVQAWAGWVLTGAAD